MIKGRRFQNLMAAWGRLLCCSTQLLILYRFKYWPLKTRLKKFLNTDDFGLLKQRTRKQHWRRKKRPRKPGNEREKRKANDPLLFKNSFLKLCNRKKLGRKKRFRKLDNEKTQSKLKILLQFERRFWKPGKQCQLLYPRWLIKRLLLKLGPKKETKWASQK